jgi:hypothetical protein
MDDSTDIKKDLMTLEADLKRLEAEYNMFFAGRLGRPPWETRGRVEALIKRWDRGYVQGSSADRFRFEMLQTRFQKFLELWDRGLRAREEGRSGPFATSAKPRPKPADADGKVLHVTAFRDPVNEMDKLHGLYDALMSARRAAGESAVPFHKFAALVKEQVTRLTDTGTSEVAFRVVVKDGRVNFTMRGMKGGEKK